MRPRRARSRSISLELTRLEDRTVPSSIVSPPGPPEPPTDPIDHEHGGLNTQPISYFLSTGTTEFLTGPQQGDPTTLALQTLQAYAFTLGLSPADAASAIVADSYSDGAGGMSHVYLRQQLNGLGVINANIGVHLTADGRVVTINGGFVPGAAALDSGTGQPPAPGLTAAEAVAAAMTYFGIASTGTPEVTGSESDAARTTVLSAPGVAGGKATANLAYANTPNGARMVWELKFGLPGGAHFYHSAVDAETGAVVFWADWVSNLETYNVFPAQQESPLDGPRQFIVDPSDPNSSPFGWHDTNGIAGAEFLDTRGNNVFAQEDQDANDFGGTRPSGGSGLLFDTPVNFAAQPTTYVNALITNLFFQNNFLHDVHYAYGFTEAAGNFQENNYGKGGTAGDAVRADAIDGSGINNANFFTPADGVDPFFGPPRMQMYRFIDFFHFPSNPTDRDSDFDNGVMYHEYGHGVSNRLTGGRTNASALDNLQSGGMGEGWSDFWALMFTQTATDRKNDSYGIGNYVLFNPPDGPGIRQSPYSFDKSINPMTFNDYGTNPGQDTEVHWTGALWASALWDMNWLLNDKYGFDPDLTTGYDPSTAAGRAGNKLALQLVMDALKIQPANPTFIQARDAILTADLTLTGGQNQREIWTAFARRGLGAGAFTFDSNSTIFAPSFNMPPDAQYPGIITQSPAGRTNTLPQSLAVTFSEDMDPTSFSLGDVVSFTGPGGVDLKNAVTSFTWNSPTELEIFFAAPAGDAAQGEYALVLAPTILSADNGSPLDQDFDGTAGETTEDQYTAFFQYDAITLTATAAPAAGVGAVLNVNDSIVVTFTEAVNPATLGTDDIRLSQGTVVGFQQVAPNQVRYDLSGMSEPRVYMTMKYGAVADLFGFPVQSLNTNFPVEIDVGPVPTPLNVFGPLGWQSYEQSVVGRIGSAGDIDTYTVDLDAGTQLTVTADQLAGIRASVTVTDPLGNIVGTAVSPSNGVPVATPTIPVATAGTYTIRMSATGSATGGFRIRVFVGALVEDEFTGGSSNDSTFLAEPVGNRMINFAGGASGISILGQVGAQQPLPSLGDLQDNYSFTAGGGQPISVGLERLSAAPGTLPTIQLLDGVTPVGTPTSPGNYFQAINFVTPAGGPRTYTIRVSGTATTPAGHDYLVSVVRNGVMDAEANNTSAAAQPVVVGSTARGGLLPGDEDWYQFTLVAPTTTVSLTTATPSDGAFEYENTLDPVIELWDNAGKNKLGTNDNGLDGRNALLASPLGPGTYRVRVLGATPTSTGEYTLFVDGSANPAPQGVSPGGPYVISEGDSVTLAASAVDPNGETLTYEWDVNGDGTFGDATGPNPTLTWANLQALLINDGLTIRPVRVRVSDGTNVIISEATTLTVQNTAPTATFGRVGSPSTEIDEGTGISVAFTAPFFDPSTADTAFGFRYSFDFNNDGIFESGSGKFAGSGTTASISIPASFFADGDQVVTVRGRIIDRDNGFRDYLLPITVKNVAPTATPTTTPFTENGIGVVSLNNAVDPSFADRSAGFHYAFDFDGDGTFEIGDGTYAGSSVDFAQVVPPSFFPEGPATLTIKARIIDKDNGFTEYTIPVTIVNAPPTGTVTNTGPVNEGSPASIDVTNVTDPSVLDTAAGFRYSYDFNNDGIFDVGTGVYATSSGIPASVQVPAAFLDDGNKDATVIVRIIDRDGGITDIPTVIPIKNIAPTAVPAIPPTVEIGTPLIASLLNSFDPSSADTTAGFTYSFDFDNNGSFDDAGDVKGSSLATASFAYQTPGPRIVRVRIQDKDGGFTDYTAAVDVLNVAPSATISPIAPVAEGGTAKVGVLATHPSTITTAAGFTYSYDLDGDGTFDLGDGLTYAGSVTEPVVDVPPGLLDDGDTTRTVRVRVFEVNGLFTDEFVTINVVNVAPSGTFTGPTGRVEVQTPVTFSFGGVVDPSATDTASGFIYSYDLNNDGDFIDPGEVSSSTLSSLVAEFPLAGSYTVRGRVADKNGGFTDHTVTVTVAPLTKTFFAAGVDAGNDPFAKLYDSTGVQKLNSAVFGPEAIGGVRVAVGDVNGDGTPDLIAGTGPGSLSEVRVLDGITGATIFSAQPFGEFMGGVFVAAGDIDGDGLADFAVSPDESGGPRVVIYNSRNRGQVASFFAIDDPNFRGGARVAMADVTGDGLADLLVAAGFGGGPRVAGFDARFLTTTRQKIFNDFFAFAPTLRNGVYIAGGDMNGDGRAEVVVGAGPGGGPEVVAFSGAGLLNDQLVPLADFFAGDSANRGGVRVAVTDFDGDRRADIITGEASGPRLNIYLAADTPSTGRPLDALELLPFSAPMNGIFVG